MRKLILHTIKMRREGGFLKGKCKECKKQYLYMSNKKKVCYYCGSIQNVK